MNRHLYLNIMYRCCGSDRRNNLRVSVIDWFTESIDARLSVNVLPSLYFQMCLITLCIWIMIIISVFVLCTCITLLKWFHILRTRVYSCRSKGFSLLTRLPSEAFSTHIIHHAGLPMKPQRRHFCIEMALQLHLIIFNGQVCYSTVW